MSDTEKTPTDLAALRAITPGLMTSEACVIEQAVAEIEMLRAALRPFATLYQAFHDRKADADVMVNINDAEITVGHVRAAMEALEPRA